MLCMTLKMESVWHLNQRLVSIVNMNRDETLCLCIFYRLLFKLDLYFFQ